MRATFNEPTESVSMQPSIWSSSKCQQSQYYSQMSYDTAQSVNS